MTVEALLESRREQRAKTLKLRKGLNGSFTGEGSRKWQGLRGRRNSNDQLRDRGERIETLERQLRDRGSRSARVKAEAAAAGTTAAATAEATTSGSKNGWRACRSPGPGGWCKHFDVSRHALTESAGLRASDPHNTKYTVNDYFREDKPKPTTLCLRSIRYSCFLWGGLSEKLAHQVNLDDNRGDACARRLPIRSDR